VTGPFTLALNIGGADVYVKTIEDPALLTCLLDFCTDVGIQYANALVKEGADMILLAEPAGCQLSPETFELFSLPYVKKMIKAIRSKCALHICGRAEHLIKHMSRLGASVLSVDDVDMTTVFREVPAGLVVAGNLSPLKLWRGSPMEIRRDTAALLKIAEERSTFIVAPGCDLSPETPLENILSFVEAVKSTSI